MELILKDKVLNLNEIIVSNSFLKFSDASLKLRPDTLVRYQDKSIDLYFLNKMFKDLLKSINHKNINFKVVNNEEMMKVQFSHDERGFNNVLIIVGVELLVSFSVDDIIVFFAHELGHLEDEVFLIKVHRKDYFYSKMIKYLCLLVIPLLSYYFSQDIFYTFFISLFSMIFIIFFYRIYYFSLLKQREFNADIFASKFVDNHEQAINSMKRLMFYLGQEMDKESYFSTHPTLKERISHLKRYFWYKKFFPWL